MPSSGPRVMIVDNDADTGTVLCEVLTEGGFSCQSARSVPAALEALHRDVFSLVLSDYVILDDADGAEWATIEKLVAAARPAPVVIFTGWPVDEDEVTQHGVSFVLRKPADVESILEAVAQQVPAAAEPEQIELVRRYFEALTRKDWEALAELCTEDVVYHVPGSDPTHSRSAIGHDALRRLAASSFADFSDAVFSVTEVLPLPAALIGRYHARWTTPAGQPAELDGAVLFHVRDRAISSIGVRLDLQRVASVMGG